MLSKLLHSCACRNPRMPYPDDVRGEARLGATLVLAVALLTSCAEVASPSGTMPIVTAEPPSATQTPGSAEATPAPTPSMSPRVNAALARLLPDELLGTAMETIAVDPNESFGGVYDVDIGNRMAEAFGVEREELEVASAVPADDAALPGVAILAIGIPDQGLRMAATGAYLYEVATRPGADLPMDTRERDQERLHLFVNDGWIFMSRAEALLVVSYDSNRWTPDDEPSLEALVRELDRVLEPTRGPSIQPDQSGPPSPPPPPAEDLEALLPPMAVVAGSYAMGEDDSKPEPWASMEQLLGEAITEVEIAFGGIDSLSINAARIDGVTGPRLVAIEVGSRYASGANFGGSSRLMAGEVGGQPYVIGDGWAYYATEDVAYSFGNVDCLFGCPADQTPFIEAVAAAVAAIPER